MSEIGFIGLGNMGGPMAQNLVKAGHRVKAFDLLPAHLAAAKSAGALPVGNVADAARGIAAVITMLPAGQQVRGVYLGDAGVIAAAAPGTLLIDCSTIDVESARHVAAAARERGLEMLDAPVSGGVAGAAAATLTFMVGGSEAGFRVGAAHPAGDGQGGDPCRPVGQRPGGEDLQQHDARRRR